MSLFSHFDQMRIFFRLHRKLLSIVHHVCCWATSQYSKKLDTSRKVHFGSGNNFGSLVLVQCCIQHCKSDLLTISPCKELARWVDLTLLWQLSSEMWPHRERKAGERNSDMVLVHSLLYEPQNIVAAYLLELGNFPLSLFILQNSPLSDFKETQKLSKH